MPLTSIPGMQGKADLVLGGIVNTEPHKAQTCLTSSALNAGGIPFGRGVVAAATQTDTGAYTRTVIQLPITGGKFVGVAMFTDSVVGILNGMPDDYTSPRGYLPNRELSVVYEGLVGVEVVSAVTQNSPVFVVVTPGANHGKFRADAASGAAIAVPNASFRGNAASGDTVALYLNLIV
jgi:hypothetical protein